ncbi:hypothetical protein ACONUD_19300 [Microbulbifer harenosus]|uniref:Uncharacterized protein n=1 Tax=Microbulbifer harenosus TaxID=2576840 RepID=A0ABY2UCG3_9GAMM|nr:hypothetical protein [Microbulbifer harenosus]TLM73022.1 hypothetical protein FDY93_19215 [Microbulbifer harenosus]
MPNTEEQRLDVIKNCDILLQTILKPFAQTDGTPEGRMIAQLKWLKERAENRDLPLPVDRDMLGTLRRVYVDGELCRHASSPERVREEVEIHMKRLIRLTREAQFLLKPAYYPYVVRCIEALITLLQQAPRVLDQYEQGLIDELTRLKELLTRGQIEPPLMSYFPDYPNFREVYSITGSSIDDIPDGTFLIKTVANLLFEGIRPDSWVTPQDADRETANLRR